MHPILPLLATLVLLGCSPPSGPAAPVTPVDSLRQEDTALHSPPRQCGLITSAAISEASGLAASRFDGGILWVHNDSGDEPRIFAIDTTGTVLAEVRIDGAAAIDWEDIASVTLGGRPWIFIADVGDNDRVRPFITVYRIEEPAISRSWRDTVIHVRAATNSFTYTDGPRNCEALAVHPTTGALYLVSKTTDAECIVSSARWLDGATSPRMLDDAARIAVPFELGALRLVTAADISPDGRRAVLRTYLVAMEFTTADTADGDALWRATPTMVELPVLTQGEALCHSLDGEALFTTTEGTPAPLWLIRRRR